MASVARSAATLAYRKAVNQTRDKGNRDLPQWLTEFRERMPEVTTREEIEEEKKGRDARKEKEELLKDSDSLYERLAWQIYSKITSTRWFEGFIVVNIILIGVTTGIDLQYRGEVHSINVFVDVVGYFTMVIFTLEIVLKLIAEANRPDRYFTDHENGLFNTFDFAIVVTGYVLIGGGNSSSVGALRMLRLVRLLTFIKGVPQLRVIVSGLVVGLNSVTYIVMLLLLIIYMCAILACNFFGTNDPARFGSVAMSMLSLFQVSTLASWTNVAYTSWWGCRDYAHSPYGVDGGASQPSMIHTKFGDFEGYQCDGGAGQDESFAAASLFFFPVYIVVTAWVIMSLFIGAITMGMFEAFEELKHETKEKRYAERLKENNAEMHLTSEGGAEGNLARAIRVALTDTHHHHHAKGSGGGASRGESYATDTNAAGGGDGEDADAWKQWWWWFQQFEFLCTRCRKLRDSPAFTHVVTATILTVGVVSGVETDSLMSCDRNQELRRSRRRRWREENQEGGQYEQEQPVRCERSTPSLVLAILFQLIFTGECLVKLLAEEYEPQRYFQDGWNCLDFFVVVTGYLEMMPGAKAIFDMFPVVILRLLRLLRVFRLAKALPRLRSIVEALMTGFNAVGWVYLLIIVFNYIMACMCMLLLQDNDPFHFGTVPRAMFNVLRIETLDTWDQILYIAMFGCDKYPNGYEFTSKGNSNFNGGGSGGGGVSGGGGDHEQDLQCTDPVALGWLGAFVVLFVVIFGSYVLPTVLIGIVSISFEEATNRAATLKSMLSKMKMVVKEADAMMPGYFTPSRVGKLRHLFSELDADDEMSLDLNEMAPFFESSFKLVFGVDLKYEHIEALFHIMDADASTELTFAEFFLFIAGMKEVERKCFADPKGFAAELFQTTPNKFSKPQDWSGFKQLSQIGQAKGSPSSTKKGQSKAKLPKKPPKEPPKRPKSPPRKPMADNSHTAAASTGVHSFSRERNGRSAHSGGATGQDHMFSMEGVRGHNGADNQLRKLSKAVGSLSAQTLLKGSGGGGNSAMATGGRDSGGSDSGGSGGLLLQDMIHESSAAVAAKFFVPSKKTARVDLCECLFQAVTAELLLVSRTDFEQGFERGSASFDAIDALVKQAADIAFGKRTQSLSPMSSSFDSSSSSSGHFSPPDGPTTTTTAAATTSMVESRLKAKQHEQQRARKVAGGGAVLPLVRSNMGQSLQHPQPNRLVSERFEVSTSSSSSAAAGDGTRRPFADSSSSRGPSLTPREPTSSSGTRAIRRSYSPSFTPPPLKPGRVGGEVKDRKRSSKLSSDSIERSPPSARPTAQAGSPNSRVPSSSERRAVSEARGMHRQSEQTHTGRI